VVGSSVKTKFEMRGGKLVGVNRHIGRRPIAAFGNSDGDLQMLQWTTAGAGPRFALYVHHTDAPASGLATLNPTSAGSIKVSTRRAPGAGPSST
jgi:hypothetical protein